MKTPRKRGRSLRVAAAIVTALISLAVVAVLGLFWVVTSGMGTDRIRHEAETAIRRLAGIDVAAAMGDPHLSLDSSRFIAIEVKDVRLQTVKDSIGIVDVGAVQFGVRFIPLLSGKLQLGSARISDARIVVPPMPETGDRAWLKALSNKDGLVEPDLVANAVFSAVHRAFDAFDVGSTRFIELSNVDFVLPEAGMAKSIHIDTASLAQDDDAGLTFEASLFVDGRLLSLQGAATRDPVSRRITDLTLSVMSPVSQPVATSVPIQSGLGAVALSLTGAEGIGGDASRLSATLSLGQSIFVMNEKTSFAGALEAVATVTTGKGKVEIERLDLATGRSNLTFHGAVGPQGDDERNDGPSYRYELISDGSTLSPNESPEPALSFGARVAGRYDQTARKLSFDQLGIRTPGGELLGTGSVEFVPGKTPGIFFAMNVPEMPMSHIKQLWPFIAARQARLWVLNNLYGGRVTDGRVQFRVAPGRLGNGVPLSGDEVFGHVAMTGSRFDVTGRIPPVRDATGTVDFRGNDVDVALTSGSIYLPSGGIVAASNGKLLIRNAHLPPVIGALDMDVAGEAGAVTELASYEPINAMRRIGMTADEFSGQVSGNVKADIPLQNGIDPNTLSWLVAMDYSNLSLSKPLNGQVVTEARGTITVDPQKAVVEAKAKLNGIPAEISLIEPFGSGGPARNRKVELVLDNKERDVFMPGLGSMLDGQVRVNLESASGTSQRIVADLTAARLNIPWAGWSKGPGVSAKVSFAMDTSGKTTKLSDFKLSGKSFAINGSMTLSGGALASARFDTVKLNQNDDASISIARSGKGYAVDINGKSLDVRAVIKQFLSDNGDGGAAIGTGSIKVSAQVDSLTGFGDERLSNVKLDYSGSGAKVGGLTVSAVTDSGGAVALTDGTDGGKRTVSMQSADAGSFLRFLDIYANMRGGSIRLGMSGASGGALRGQVDAANFQIVNEPKLRSIVSTTPAGDSKSLNEAVRSDIDTSQVTFERGFAGLEKGSGYLLIGNGVLRGPLIGTTFQGTLYDTSGNMDMTGTFMPAYGLNRIFGEIPLVGQILGNGRDRGLIGVTYKLAGKVKSPKLQINPLSVIAPGIFRSIFEFR